MSKGQKFTIQELYQFAYDYMKNQYESRWFMDALKETNNDIPKAIKLCREKGGWGSWGGFCGPGMPNVESHFEIEKGYLRLWNEIPESNKTKPDLELTTEEAFRLVRDGIQAQLTLF